MELTSPSSAAGDGRDARGLQQAGAARAGRARGRSHGPAPRASSSSDFDSLNQLVGHDHDARGQREGIGADAAAAVAQRSSW